MRLGAEVLDVYSCWWAWADAIWPCSILVRQRLGSAVSGNMGDSAGSGDRGSVVGWTGGSVEMELDRWLVR